jgi:hypothetical protein
VALLNFGLETTVIRYHLKKTVHLFGFGEIDMLRINQLLVVAFIALPSFIFAAEPPKAAEKTSTAPSKEQLEKKFQETLTAATLTGHFTDQNKPQGALPKEEKYTIESVTKLQDDYWLFKSRIQYGEHDVTLPLPLRVVWAGDTPVITLDKVPVPGFGTFTCRVMIYDDKYAGMWEGANHGGLLFGKITREQTNDK